jgi:hypothetical protein
MDGAVGQLSINIVKTSFSRLNIIQIMAIPQKYRSTVNAAAK